MDGRNGVIARSILLTLADQRGGGLHRDRLAEHLKVPLCRIVNAATSLRRGPAQRLLRVAKGDGMLRLTAAGYRAADRVARTVELGLRLGSRSVTGSIQQRLLHELAHSKGRVSPRDLARRIGASRGAVRFCLWEMRQVGLVEPPKMRRGKWLPPKLAKGG